VTSASYAAAAAMTSTAAASSAAVSAAVSAAAGCTSSNVQSSTRVANSKFTFLEFTKQIRYEKQSWQLKASAFQEQLTVCVLGKYNSLNFEMSTCMFLCCFKVRCKSDVLNCQR
jgi:vacuolar-type H+-ATPase catalytic subunit A/Vma1